MQPSNNRAGRIILAAILLLGLGARLSWSWRQSRDTGALDRLPDQREYLQLGKHLHENQGFWFFDPRFLQVVYAYRTPGYPFLISWCAARPGIVRGVQSLLDTSTILAIYLLARRWLSPRAAILAAALVAFDPFMIYFTGVILSETLFTAMLCWGIALLVQSGGPWPKGNLRLTMWLLGGLILALSVLVRPGAIALPVVLGCGAALAGAPEKRINPQAYRSRWPLPVAATFILLTALALFPWAARNRWLLGSWIWTSTNAGITTFDGFNPDATGASDQRFALAMPWTRDMTEVGRSQYFERLADEWMRNNTLAAFELAGVKILRTWSPVPLSSEFGSRWVYVAIGLSFSTLFYLLILAGLWFGSLPSPVKRFLLLPAIYFTAAAALSVGSLRYRIPAQPPMAILAASVLNRRANSRSTIASRKGDEEIPTIV